MMNDLNLVPAIKEIEKQIRDLEYEYKEKIRPYKDSLEQLRLINTTCERCCGKGKILRSRSCAEDDVDPRDPNDWEICPVCKGTKRSK